jgi:3-dehydroquinate dehydratase/shikimate dehydrogenase
MSRPLIAVAIGVRDTDEALRALAQVAQVADLAEIRLDLMQSYDLPRLLRGRPCPVVITNRPAREGGRFQGDEFLRVHTLLQAVELGAEHVDIEWDSAYFLADVNRWRTRVIISRHDFEKMPDDFQAQYQTLAAEDADIIKVVGMAHQAADLVPVIQVLRDADRPTIAIAMGEVGMASRILALRHPSCYLTYAALGDGSGTAPGQVTVSDLREVYRAHEINADTVAFAHLAPTLPSRDLLAAGNAALRAAGANAVWVPLVVPRLEVTTLAMLEALDLAGCSVDAALTDQVAPALAHHVAGLSGERADTLVRKPDGSWVGRDLGMDVQARAAWWVE